MSNVLILDYKNHEKSFVGRKQEVKDVLEIVEHLLKRQKSATFEKRTIAFIGERGIGKSWLMSHLEDQLNRDFPQAKTYKIELREYADSNNSETLDPTRAVLEILEKFGCAFDVTPKQESVTPLEISRRIMENVRNKYSKEVIVVFVDHVYESDWKLLANLEDYLLGPLAIEPNTLIVLAGRGREYPWKTPELRLKAIFKDLKHLDLNETTQQLIEQVSKKAAKRAGEIYNYTEGNPLGNYIRGAHGNNKEALNAIIESSLEFVTPLQRPKLRQNLEALCVLRAFDEERIPKILAAYYEKTEVESMSYAEARQIRDDLVKYSFARWDEKRSGFVLDPLLQNTFQEYLREVQPKIWVRLQKAAYDLYDSWNRKYPSAAAYWKAEVSYHSKFISASH